MEFRIGDYIRFDMPSAASGGIIGKITGNSENCVVCDNSEKVFWDKEYINNGNYLIIPHELVESKLGKLLWTM